MTSKKTIRLDIVSDVVCPWCIVGYKRLERALELVADDLEVDVHWHPFELNPNMPQEGQELREHIMQKYGTTAEQSAQARQRLLETGKALGFEFDYFDGMRMVNTFKAHQLLHYARTQGKETELKLRLFAAFFSERKDVSDLDLLVKEAATVGLDEQESRAILEEDSFADAVRQEEHHWLSRGVQAVPTFVVNQTQGLSGAQDEKVLAEFLRRA